MTLIKTIIDYYKLRRLGVKATHAWKMSSKGNNYTEYFILLIIIACVLVLVLDYYIATDKLMLSELRWQVVEAKINASESYAMANKLERAVIACLNNESVVIDGIDRPCKFGNYKNGSAIF